MYKERAKAQTTILQNQDSLKCRLNELKVNVMVKRRIENDIAVELNKPAIQ